MSLRLRLTLLYTSLLGGVLLIFGSLVYTMVSVVLLDQMDTTLSQEAVQIISQLRVDSNNNIDASQLPKYQPAENLFVQVWGNQNQLIYSRPAGIPDPLDQVGRYAGTNVYHQSIIDGLSLRVLSIPLKSARGPAGILQVGLNLALVNITQRTLASVLILLLIVAMFFAGLAAWLVTGRALAPLTVATEIAAGITRAEDLQRRIPVIGTQDDEIAILIRAFNETLERLEKLFTTQRRFLADVSHELRTPLTVIKGNAALMRRVGEADEESLVSIEDEVDRLTRMVGDLLLLAQVESGNLPLNMAPVELDTVILEVFQQMRVLAGERINLRLVEIDQLQVMGDRDRLKQVFLNLVGNAVQYTQPGGQVTIAVRKVANQAQVIVTDTGPGIPAEDLPHIFERFYRGEKSRKRGRGTGFGLGLSIAYYIVRNHGGNIEVTSQEGVGTTFAVWLPLLKENET